MKRNFEQYSSLIFHPTQFFVALLQWFLFYLKGIFLHPQVGRHLRCSLIFLLDRRSDFPDKKLSFQQCRQEQNIF